ncbi:hypothetical protein GQ42DRAFT_181587 [Ramicandelaber brevisporus]|nr:hypothetical protein GQ42DRAFT_181587 [Ramicandelaber brevisporus]
MSVSSGRLASTSESIADATSSVVTVLNIPHDPCPQCISETISALKSVPGITSAHINVPPAPQPQQLPRKNSSSSSSLMQQPQQKHKQQQQQQQQQQYHRRQSQLLLSDATVYHHSSVEPTHIANTLALLCGSAAIVLSMASTSTMRDPNLTATAMKTRVQSADLHGGSSAGSGGATGKHTSLIASKRQSFVDWIGSYTARVSHNSQPAPLCERHKAELHLHGHQQSQSQQQSQQQEQQQSTPSEHESTTDGDRTVVHSKSSSFWRFGRSKQQLQRSNNTDLSRHSTTLAFIDCITCPTQAAALSLKLRSACGVSQATVLVVPSSLQIVHDPTTVSVTQLAAIVERAGFAFHPIGTYSNQPSISNNSATFAADSFPVPHHIDYSPSTQQPYQQHRQHNNNNQANTQRPSRLLADISLHLPLLLAVLCFIPIVVFHYILPLALRFNPHNSFVRDAITLAVKPGSWPAAVIIECSFCTLAVISLGMLALSRLIRLTIGLPFPSIFTRVVLSTDGVVFIVTTVSYILAVWIASVSNGHSSLFDIPVLVLLAAQLIRFVMMKAQSRVLSDVSLWSESMPRTAQLVKMEHPPSAPYPAGNIAGDSGDSGSIITAASSHPSDPSVYGSTSGDVSHSNSGSQASPGGGSFVSSSSSSPDSVHVYGPREIVTTVGSQQLLPGDVVVVRAGSRFPCDGIIISEANGNITASASVSTSAPNNTANVTVDESSLFGTSGPSFKKCGDLVYAGTTNLNVNVRLQVVRAGQNTCLAQLITMVTGQQAAASPAPRTDIADKSPLIVRALSKWTTRLAPMLIILSAIVTLVWFLLTPMRIQIGSFHHHHYGPSLFEIVELPIDPSPSSLSDDNQQIDANNNISSNSNILQSTSTLLPPPSAAALFGLGRVPLAALAILRILAILVIALLAHGSVFIGLMLAATRARLLRAGIVINHQLDLGRSRMASWLLSPFSVLPECLLRLELLDLGRSRMASWLLSPFSGGIEQRIASTSCVIVDSQSALIHGPPRVVDVYRIMPKASAGLASQPVSSSAMSSQTELFSVVEEEAILPDILLWTAVHETMKLCSHPSLVAISEWIHGRLERASAIAARRNPPVAADALYSGTICSAVLESECPLGTGVCGTVTFASPVEFPTADGGKCRLDRVEVRVGTEQWLNTGVGASVSNLEDMKPQTGPALDGLMRAGKDVYIVAIKPMVLIAATSTTDADADTAQKKSRTPSQRSRHSSMHSSRAPSTPTSTSTSTSMSTSMSTSKQQKVHRQSKSNGSPSTTFSTPNSASSKSPSSRHSIQSNRARSVSQQQQQQQPPTSVLPPLPDQPHTSAPVATAVSRMAIISVASPILPDAKHAISNLRQNGVDVWLMSPSATTATLAIARQCGIDHVLPQMHSEDEKVRAIDWLKTHADMTEKPAGRRGSRLSASAFGVFSVASHSSNSNSSSGGNNNNNNNETRNGGGKSKRTIMYIGNLSTGSKCQSAADISVATMPSSSNPGDLNSIINSCQHSSQSTSSPSLPTSVVILNDRLSNVAILISHTKSMIRLMSIAGWIGVALVVYLAIMCSGATERLFGYAFDIRVATIICTLAVCALVACGLIPHNWSLSRNGFTKRIKRFGGSGSGSGDSTGTAATRTKPTVTFADNIHSNQSTMDSAAFGSSGNETSRQQSNHQQKQQRQLPLHHHHQSLFPRSPYPSSQFTSQPPQKSLPLQPRYAAKGPGRHSHYATASKPFDQHPVNSHSTTGSGSLMMRPVHNAIFSNHYPREHPLDHSAGTRVRSNTFN